MQVKNTYTTWILIQVIIRIDNKNGTKIEVIK